MRRQQTSSCRIFVGNSSSRCFANAQNKGHFAGCAPTWQSSIENLGEPSKKLRKPGSGAGTTSSKPIWTTKNTTPCVNTLKSVAAMHLDTLHTATAPTKETMEAFSSCIGISQVERYDIEGCGYQAFFWEAKARSILVVAVYFRTNETSPGPTNSKQPTPHFSFATGLKPPVHDWKNHPEHFQSTVLSSKFHWQILAPDATVLNGNTVDYAIMHQNLAAYTSMTAEWAVPWRPTAW